jgi:hypothetical protein
MGVPFYLKLVDFLLKLKFVVTPPKPKSQLKSQPQF